VQSIAYHSAITPWFEHVLYEPFLRTVRFAARQVRRLQSGSMYLYLMYVAVALVLLLVIARWF
jgi:hydrogenase-4 component B